jgi:valyl-tRNA synthetase
MLAPYPIADPSKIDNAATSDIEWLKSVILGVRNIRGEMNISPSVKLPLYFANGSEQDKQRLDNTKTFLGKLAGIETTQWLNAGEEAPLSATTLVGSMEILVPMAGFIDKDAEVARLNKEIEKLGKEAARINGKLSNAGFVDKAPAAVVDKEKMKLNDYNQAVEKLKLQREKIEAM